MTSRRPGAAATGLATARPGGFTLVEVVIGLTVASIALTIGAVALGAVHDRSEHADEVTRAAVSGATQRALLVEWLSGAHMHAATGERFEGMQTDQAGHIVEQLMFPTTARTPLGMTSSVVALYIDDDPATPERGLVAELTGMPAGMEVRRMELVPEAGGMHVRYLSNAGGISIWTDMWSGQNRLPRLVEITVVAAPGETLPLLLQYPLRVALGGGL
jgi:prepilin-type N-terminal cleavage/methylation domain-containing protein